TVGVDDPQRAAATGSTTGATGMTAYATTPSAEAKRRGPLLAGLAVLVGAGAAGAFYFSRSEPPATSVAPPPSVTAAPPPTAPAAPSCPEGMAMIEGGHMFMGSTDEDLGEDVRPPHKVTVSSFCLDETEVSTK